MMFREDYAFCTTESWHVFHKMAWEPIEFKGFRPDPTICLFLRASLLGVYFRLLVVYFAFGFLFYGGVIRVPARIVSEQLEHAIHE